MSTSDRTHEPLGLAPDQEAAHLEYTQLRAENVRLREALRLACQDLRGPGVPVDDLMADYLRAAITPSDER